MKRLYVLVHKGWLEVEHNYEILFIAGILFFYDVF